jgi:hypothetical protein
VIHTTKYLIIPVKSKLAMTAKVVATIITAGSVILLDRPTVAETVGAVNVKINSTISSSYGGVLPTTPDSPTATGTPKSEFRF